MKKLIIGILTGGFIIGGIALAADPFVFRILQGGTNTSSFSPNSIVVSGTTTTSALYASSTPSLSRLIATSTSATSTIQYGLKILTVGLTSETLVSCDTINTTA